MTHFEGRNNPPGGRNDPGRNDPGRRGKKGETTRNLKPRGVGLVSSHCRS